jgi:hypothetical protein
MFGDYAYGQSSPCHDVVPSSSPLDGWRPCTLAAPPSDQGLVLNPTCSEPYGNFDIVGAVGSPEQSFGPGRASKQTASWSGWDGRSTGPAEAQPKAALAPGRAGCGRAWQPNGFVRPPLAMRAELPLDVLRDHVAQFALRSGLPGRSGSSRRGAACQRTAHAKEGERNAHVGVALRTSKAARSGGTRRTTCSLRVFGWAPH